MKTLPAHLSVVLVAVILVAMAAGAIETQAQPPAAVARVRPLYSVQSDYGYHGHSTRPHYRIGLYPAYGRYGGVTAAGSYARELAAMTYAQGQYNRLTAEARAIHAEAERLEIENREMAADTYFAMRQASQQARAAERRPRPSSSEIAERARQAAPDHLSDDQLNAHTGELSWPLLLQTDRFATSRSELQAAFIHRAAHGGLASQQGLEARQAAYAMQTELKELVRQVHPTDYIEAQQFLRSLVYEVQLSVI